MTRRGSEPPSAPASSGRRTFLKQSALSSGALATAGMGQAATPTARSTVRTYRRLGRTDLEISDISFGSSRLRRGQEDVVRHALELGVNYFDTAESYGQGVSETVLGNALKGQRDKVILASKQHCGARTTKATLMRELEASLRRLQTDRIEVYFNHAVNDVSRLQNDAWYEFVADARRQGKIQYTGLSGHAGRLVPVIDYAVDNDLVDVVLVGYNFGQDPKFYEGLTRSFDFVATQPDLPRVLAKAQAADIGVIAMKTLMGARLNDLRSYEAEGNTFAQAAFRWTLSNADVDALIVSMTATEQIDEYLGASGAKALAKGDLELLESYARRNGMTYCKHACDQCESSCPYGVQIADVLRTRMYATDYGDARFAQAEYSAITQDASPCLGCNGAPCAGACPHGIDIAALCAPTHRMLA
ncbi:MAG: aldo/keto reductase [Pseudomonadota bacterium]